MAKNTISQSQDTKNNTSNDQEQLH